VWSSSLKEILTKLVCIPLDEVFIMSAKHHTTLHSVHKRVEVLCGVQWSTSQIFACYTYRPPKSRIRIFLLGYTHATLFLLKSTSTHGSIAKGVWDLSKNDRRSGASQVMMQSSQFLCVFCLGFCLSSMSRLSREITKLNFLPRQITSLS